MRKAVIIVSLVSMMFVSADFIIPVFPKLAQLSWLPLLLGFIAILAAVILDQIYAYRMDRVKKQQLEQWGIVVQTNIDLIRCKAKEVRPYKREFWLYFAKYISIMFVIIASDVMRLILPQIEATFHWVVWLIVPVSIFIYTFLSRDLTKN